MVMGGGQSLGTAVLDLRADGKGLKQDLGRAEKDTKRSFGGMVGSAKNLQRGLIAGFAGSAVVAGVGKAIGAASDLQESINKTRVTFGDAAGAMPGFSGAVAESLGMSRQAALDAAAGIGSMLIPMGVSQGEAAKMSARMTTLAADLGSFHNADPTDMLDRLRAGLSGESEPLKRFGIVLNETRVAQEAYRMGIAETGAQLTDSQKIQARYSLAIRDAGKANGDFERTSGGLANQQRILKAEVTDLAASLGGALLPAATGGVQALRGVVGFLSDHQGSIAAAAAVIREGLAVAWDYVRRAVDAAMPTIRNIITTVQAVVGTVQRLWDRFGENITRVVREAFGIVRTVVEGALRQVRGVIDLAMALLRGDWGDAWDALKGLASNALLTAAKLLRGILAGLGPALARLALQAALAIGAAIARGVLSGLAALASLPVKLGAMVVGAVGSVAARALGAASAIGRAIVNGAVSGAGNMASVLREWVESQVRSALDRLNPFSPVEHGGSLYIGQPIMDGAIKGILAKAPKLKQTLTGALREAVEDARGNLESLAGGLGSAAGEVIAERARARIGALANTPEGKRLAEIEAQQAGTSRARESARLEKAVADAAAAMIAAGPEEETPEERTARVLKAQEDLTAATVALGDYQLEEEARQLREGLATAEQAISDEEEARAASLERQLANLTRLFNAGLLKQKDYVREVREALGDAEVDYKMAGHYLGASFASGFAEQLDALIRQAAKLTATPGAWSTGIAVQDPMDVWRERDRELERARNAIRNNPPEKGSDPKAYAKARATWEAELETANRALSRHRSSKPRPLGLGGILSSPTLGLLAERGYPEVAAPLDGSSRSWALLAQAAAMMPERGAGAGGRGGPLVTVQRLEVRGPEDIALVAARLSTHLASKGVRA